MAFPCYLWAFHILSENATIEDSSIFSDFMIYVSLSLQPDTDWKFGSHRVFSSQLLPYRSVFLEASTGFQPTAFFSFTNCICPGLKAESNFF